MHEMSPAAPCIVLGAPRSGTSLLAGWLHHSGVLMGDRFLEPDEGNPGGYFEDLDFLELHRRFLSRSEGEAGRLLEDSTLREAPIRCDLPEQDRQAARALVETRIRAAKPWGWKDPRTGYYLDLWDELLPGANYLLTYRHPLKVCASLLRMGRNWDCLFDPLLPLRSWTFAMQQALRFVERLPPERISVFAAEAMWTKPDQLASELGQSLNRSIDAESLREIRRPSASRAAPPVNRRQHAIFAKYFPAAAETFNSLQAKASFPVPLAKKLWTRDPVLRFLESSQVAPGTALQLFYDSIQPSLREAHRDARHTMIGHAKDYIRQRFQSEEALRQSYEEQSAYLQERLTEMQELRKGYRELLEHSKKQKEHIAKLSEFINSVKGSQKGGK